jgi:beta-carotene ketolase (CrtW type)
MRFFARNTGLLLALLILFLWASALWALFSFAEVGWAVPLTYAGVLIQTHLYTGLFITAHDAMHGLVSPNRRINRLVGTVCAGLFAFNYFKMLNTKHHDHHRFPGTDRDPDFYEGNFWVWYFHFVKQYVSIWQILLMAVSFNLLKLWLPTDKLIVFWMLPSVLATFQLFYFGTYLPHKGEHAADNHHRARSQRLNHWWAFLSCYFFGYHYEHHASPGTPWWKLYREKEKLADKRYV